MSHRSFPFRKPLLFSDSVSAKDVGWEAAAGIVPRRDLLQGFSDPVFQQKRKDRVLGEAREQGAKQQQPTKINEACEAVALSCKELVASLQLAAQAVLDRVAAMCNASRHTDPRKFSAERQKLFLTVQLLTCSRKVKDLEGLLQSLVAC